MKSKVGIIGTGMVGMSYAYSMVNQGTCEELVLIDINKEKTEGEAAGKDCFSVRKKQETLHRRLRPAAANLSEEAPPGIV